MTIETMVREFRYDEIRLPDPTPRLSVDEVRTAFSATYPEIATAALTRPEAVGNKLVYRFLVRNPVLAGHRQQRRQRSVRAGTAPEPPQQASGAPTKSSLGALPG